MSTESPSLTSEQAIALLDLLIGDDDFRTRFAADPAAALGELGIDCGTKPPPCSCVDVLASKTELAEAREQLLRYLGDQVHMQGTPVFESGKVQAALAQH